MAGLTGQEAAHVEPQLTRRQQLKQPDTDERGATDEPETPSDPSHCGSDQWTKKEKGAASVNPLRQRARVGGDFIQVSLIQCNKWC